MKHIRTAGAVFALAAVALTGAACGGDSKNAVKSGASASADAGEGTIRGLLGVTPQQASVRVGNFCSDAGSVARTSDGKAATCVKKSGDKQGRWTAEAKNAAPVTKATVRVGNFCSDVGAIGQTSAGKEATCVKPAGQSRARWGEAKAGSTTVPGVARGGAFCAPQGAKANSGKSVTYSCGKKSGDKQARWRQ